MIVFLLLLYVLYTYIYLHNFSGFGANMNHILNWHLNVSAI